MKEKKLYIQKFQEETQQQNIPYSILNYYYDLQLKIPVLQMSIDANLQVGGIYEFDYVSDYVLDNDGLSYIYMVLKKENNIYYITQYYRGFHRVEESLLGKDYIYCNFKKDLGIDISRFQNSINHLLYTVITKDNNYLEFYYNGDFEELYIHDVKHDKGVDFPNSDDAITVINVVDMNNIKSVIIEEYFIEECKEELIRRFNNHELTDIEMLLYQNCIEEREMKI